MDRYSKRVLSAHLYFKLAGFHPAPVPVWKSVTLFSKASLDDKAKSRQFWYISALNDTRISEAQSSSLHHLSPVARENY